MQNALLVKDCHLLAQRSKNSCRSWISRIVYSLRFRKSMMRRKQLWTRSKALLTTNWGAPKSARNIMQISRLMWWWIDVHKNLLWKQNLMPSRINLLILRQASMTLRLNIKLCVRISPTNLRLSNKFSSNVFLQMDRRSWIRMNAFWMSIMLREQR